MDEYCGDDEGDDGAYDVDDDDEGEDDAANDG